MNQYDYITSLNKEQLIDWLDTYADSDISPWRRWFDENYCSKCEPIKCSYAECEKLNIKPFYKSNLICSYCEWEKKCKYFPDLEEVPNSRKMIELWLETPYNELPIN